MSDAPSIGVLIPTRNCAPFLPDHIKSVMPWIDLAEEIVVVDSDSRDGTVEMLKARLPQERTTYLTHPPGLYQSWNFGIQNIRAKYIYISTVGDSITRAGLEHLLRVAEEFQCDAVLSKPHFIRASGEAAPDSRWLIDQIVDRLEIRGPRLLSLTEQFLFTVTNLWCALLGSSASNLYRADCLKQRPFPLEYGTAGDGAWGVENIFDITIAITPERFSNFRQHEKAYSLSDYYVESLTSKLFLLAQAVVARQRKINPAIEPLLANVCWTELEQSLDPARLAHLKLEAYRKGKVPWFLNPAAWKARSVRNRGEATVARIVDRVLNTGRKD